MRVDAETQEEVLTLTGEVCELVEQLSGPGSRQSKEIADKLSELLEIPKVDPSLSLDIKDKSRFPDVEEALAKLALNSSGIEKEERIDIKGTVIITNICVDPARKAIISTAQVGALGDNQDILELSRIVGDPNDSTRINYLVGEHHSLIGSPDAENVRKNLHRIAGLLGLKYFLNPERDAVIPGPIEDYRAFVDILNDAARAQIGTDTFQTDRHNLPITELDSADEELRRKYPFINPGNNLVVDKVLLPNDHSRYFNHCEYARLMTVLRNRISAEDVVLGNNVLLMAGDGELRAYYRRWLKPLGGISGQDNKIINKVLINCNSDDGTQNCVIFGTGHRASTGKYAQSTIINLLASIWNLIILPLELQPVGCVGLCEGIRLSCDFAKFP
jgi:hypothetical protein